MIEPAGHRPPGDCPVCGDRLHLTRLSCGSCGTELSGVFASCAFCRLSDAQRDLLQVFLISRGNLREVERHLGVSYPTARQRYAELLVELGLEPVRDADSVPPTDGSADGTVQTRSAILARLANGDLDVDTAGELLRSVAE